MKRVTGVKFCNSFFMTKYDRQGSSGSYNIVVGSLVLSDLLMGNSFSFIKGNSFNIRTIKQLFI